jgi:ATP-dependent Lon protease
MIKESDRDVILNKLLTYFPGKIVRKDLTKKIKEGANVPVYVLEYLLGMYCSSQDSEVIEEGVRNVKDILARNYVRPDEAQKIISKLRELGSYTIIDKITVKLNYRTDTYEAEFSNLGLRGIPISSSYPSEFERLLAGGIWCIVQMEYFYDEEDKNRIPFIIRKLTPVQMPGINMDELKEARKHFSDEEWIDIILRSTGMEPDSFDIREKWLHLARLIPLVENNYNFCELGPRGTGKSHIYKEISPNSILVSGGQTTVANLFYNMASKQVGLVGLWDCVAFIGNINQSVDILLKTSHLFEPFPEAMGMDTAFLDRMHCYSPGWEIPKYMPGYFTDDYGFITDYFAEIMRELRKISYGDAHDKYFRETEEPAIIIIFGDHNPWLGKDNSVYKMLGINLNLQDIEGFKNYYQTPYLIWGNDGAKKILGKDLKGESKTMSPNFLMSELFDCLGWEGNEYMQYITKMKERFDVNHRLYFKENNEFTTELSEENNKIWQEFKNIEYFYSNNFGK